MLELLTIKEAMQLTGLNSYKTFNKLVLAGLPVVVVDDVKRISKADLLQFIEDHKTTTNKEG